MAMALTSARADVVINTTNFPDPGLRAALVDCGIDDGDGVLTDEEIENATDYIHLEGCKNLKGLEVHTSVILSQVDTSTFRKLGVNLTSEPHYQTKKLYHR